jgi:hypothetical protein
MGDFRKKFLLEELLTAQLLIKFTLFSVFVLQVPYSREKVIGCYLYG